MYDAWTALPKAVVGVGKLAGDAVGYAENALLPQRSALTGESIPYQPSSGLLQSIQQNGVAGTVGGAIVGTVRNAPGIGLIGSLYAPNRDWGSIGAQTFNTAVAGAAPILTYVAGDVGNAAATLSRIEGRFADASREVGFIVDSDSGAILGIRRAGFENGTQISLDPVKDYPLMEGNIFTHNHPLGGNLSPGDISTALGSGTSEFRAVTSNRTMSISFGEAPEGLIGEPAGSVVFMNGEKAAIGASSRAGIADGSVMPPVDTAAKNIWMSDYFMQQLTTRNPWINYTVTPR